MEKKHKWKKIDKELFKTEATHHCNKCGVLGKEAYFKCSNPKCNNKIKDFSDDNEDSEGNKYCLDCIAKIQLVAEQTGENYD